MHYTCSINLICCLKIVDWFHHINYIITKNRPIVSKIEGNLYYFDWLELQLEEYFIRFGRDAIVIKPSSLKERIKKFYYYGLREYSK